MLDWMDVETEIRLDSFKYRPYQADLIDAMENRGYKRALVLWPRRAGKDITCFNYILRCALQRVGLYMILYPTYSQGRKILFSGIDNDGNRFLDFCPPELIENINQTEMRITLKNNSIIQVAGSDNYDSLVGTNPIGICFSEFALQDPRAYQFLRPALTGNNGWAVFISTPRGKNHLYELYQIAINNPEHWYCSKLTVNETGHISLADIERERISGEMSEDLIQQEYFSSFEMGVEGSYYSKYIDRMRLAGRIGIVPHETGFKTHVVVDIGVRDSTAIIWFQCIGTTVRIINCYDNSKVGLEHYAKVIHEYAQDYGYIYGKFFAPHDIKVQEFGTGCTRLEMARRLGLNFIVTPDLSVMDGIETLRSAFSKMWIDETSCKPLINALENYRSEYDVKRGVYKATPLHNKFSHYADAARYMAINLGKCRDGTSPEEIDRRYNEAMFGSSQRLPSVFRDDIGRY